MHKLSKRDHSQMSSIDLDSVLKAVLAVLGAVAATYQIRAVIPKPRAALKSDIEILRLLDPSDPNYRIVKASIDEKIELVYGDKTEQRTHSSTQDWFYLIFGASWACVFAYITFYIVKDGFTWWALLTGYIAAAGFSLMMFPSMKRRMGTGWLCDDNDTEQHQ